jgi:hypothetical protein
MQRYIYAMSKAQRAIYAEVEAASKQIDQHLIRLMLYPDSEHVSHWKQEICSFLNSVDLLKGKNKWPSKRLLMKALTTHNDILDTYTWQVIDWEDELTPLNVSPSTIRRGVEFYQDWLAECLSENGAISKKLAYRVLDDIVNFNF